MKNSIFKRLTAVLLALAMGLSLIACGQSEAGTAGAGGTTAAAESTTQAGTSAAEEATTEAGYITGEIILNENLPAYYHYDSTGFLEDCETLKTLLSDGDMETFCSMYTEMQKELLDVYDLQQIAVILADKDVTDEQMQNESLYAQNMYTDIKNTFNAICAEACTGDKAEEFRNYLNDDVVFELYKTYTEKSPELLALMEEEKALITEYKTCYNDLDQFTYDYEGKTYCLSDVNEMDLDDETSYGIYTEVMRRINEGLGEIYVKLVKNRQQQAPLLGYESYADYADKVLYYRDCEYEELEYIRETLKYYGEYIDDLRSFVYYGVDEPVNMTDEEFIKSMESTVKDVSDVAYNCLERMINEGVYDIEARGNKSDNGYITSFRSVNDGYLFYTRSENTYDYQVLSHELGHYVETVMVELPFATLMDDKMDLMEIHSTGLQILFAMEAGEECYGENYRKIYGKEIVSLLDYAYDGFEGDEFERKVYADPDITLEKVNQYYKETILDYGEYEYDTMEYYWMNVEHFFEYPFYYLSYGISGFTSLQIYLIARDDYEAGVKVWESIVQDDWSHKSYEEIITAAGLSMYTDEEVCIDTIYYPLADAYDIAEETGLTE